MHMKIFSTVVEIKNSAHKNSLPTLLKFEAQNENTHIDLPKLLKFKAKNNAHENVYLQC